MTLVEDLLASGEPHERQHRREARIELAGLLQQAARRIESLEGAVNRARDLLDKDCVLLAMEHLGDVMGAREDNHG